LIFTASVSLYVYYAEFPFAFRLHIYILFAILDLKPKILGATQRRPAMAAGDIPLYFEGSWSILSSIGLINALFGLMIIGITGYSPIILVPIVVSVSAAIANGLCYYVLYETHGTNALVLGGVFADMFWLV